MARSTNTNFVLLSGVSTLASGIQVGSVLQTAAPTAYPTVSGFLPDLSICQDQDICDPIPGLPCFCDNVATALQENPDQTCESIDSPLLNPNIPASEFIISCPQTCGICEADVWPCKDYDAEVCAQVQASGLSCAEFAEEFADPYDPNAYDPNAITYIETVCGVTCGVCEAEDSNVQVITVDSATASDVNTTQAARFDPCNSECERMCQQGYGDKCCGTIGWGTLNPECWCDGMC